MNDTGAAAHALLARTPRGMAAALLLLAVLASLSEGIGLLMLVPALRLAGDGEGSDPWLAKLIDFGVTLSLETILAAFVALIAFRALVVQLRMLTELRLQTRVTESLRRDVFGAIIEARWRFLAQVPRGQLIAVAVGAIDRIGYALQSVLSALSATLTLAALFAAALLISPVPTLALGAGGLVVLGLYAGFRRRAAEDGASLNRAMVDHVGFFVERVNALRLVKSFGTEWREAAQAATIAGRVYAMRLSFQRGLAAGQLTLQAGAALVLAGAVWLALRWGSTPLVTVLPLVGLAARALPLLSAVQASWQQWAHGAPAMAEITALMTSANEAAEPHEEDVEPPALGRSIALQSVTVRHEGRGAPAVADVSLILPAGGTLFLTGPSGAGKSTLADILGGLITPDAGTVLVDGQPLDDRNRRAWRRQVAYVQQDAVLFTGTVRDNLLWAEPDASELAMTAALRDAAAGFVFDLPTGLDSFVGDGGRELSGGERQRLALARALLRRPRLLILDEATSALDAASETAVAEAVARLKGKMAIVIVAHRGNLASLADAVVTLNGGRIANVEAPDSWRV